MYRYKLYIEYKGTNFNGWEGNNNSIRYYIELALCKLFNINNISLYCAGRTDTGVHAINQIAHFDTNKNLEIHKIIKGLNYYINNVDIKVKDCILVDNTFHARFGATEKHYKYLIYNEQQPSTIINDLSCHISKKLNIELIKEASQYLIGRHDFSTFCPTQYTGKRNRSINNIFIEYEYFLNYQLIAINFQARSFLYNQVRSMIGGLLSVGLLQTSVSEFIKKFNNKNRNTGWITSQAKGLYLISISY